MPIDREKVFKKYGGHCAYCGCVVSFNKFQVDHIHPKFKWHWPEGKNIDREENLNPACAPCNRFKSTMNIELFRQEIFAQVNRALETSTQFQRALRYGQVVINPKPVIFYFENESNLPITKRRLK